MTPYYTDEQVTIYHGDCRDVVHDLGLTVDLIVADPPYGETSLPWDCWPDGWPTVATLAASSMWCFGSMRMFLERSAEFAAWRLSQDVVWEKPRPRGMTADRFARAHELVVFWYRGKWSEIYKSPQKSPHYGKPGSGGSEYLQSGGVYGSYVVAQYEDDGTRLLTSVLRGAAGDPRRVLHPTQKPTTVLDPLIRYGCPPGGTVLDLFAGSGSTLEAARTAARRAIGIEMDEKYCEIAARRLAQGILTPDGAQP